MGNYGTAKPRVAILSGSPFGIPKQEKRIQFNSRLREQVLANNTIKGVGETNVTLLPDEIGGWRLQETIGSHDNWIMDHDGLRLEEAEVEIEQTSYVIDPVAKARAEAAKDDPSFSQKEQDFFTWKTINPIVKTNNAAVKFNEYPKPDPRPFWTYTRLSRPSPNNDADDKIEVICPWQTKAPPDPQTPVHWGAEWPGRRDVGWVRNQPFELTLFYYFRDPNPAAKAETLPLARDWRLVGSNGEPLDLDLTRSLYFAVELGGYLPNDDPEVGNHFLVLFVYKRYPMLFQFVTEEDDPVAKTGYLVSQYQVESAKENLFTGESISVAFEAVAGKLWIRCSAFADSQPWVVWPSNLRPVTYTETESTETNEGSEASRSIDSLPEDGWKDKSSSENQETSTNQRTRTAARKYGIFIPMSLAIYGGNIQAGFHYTPITYEYEGTIGLPPMPFDTDDTQQPEVTVLERGVNFLGETQQLRASCDAETVTDLEPNQGRSFINSIGGISHDELNMTREIMIQKNIYKAVDGGQYYVGENLLGGLQGILFAGENYYGKVSVKPEITLRASDVTPSHTIDGYTIRRGRSPYIWALRAWVPATGVEPTETFDITGDVISLDLSWSSEGIGDWITGTGTMRVISEPRTAVPWDENGHLPSGLLHMNDLTYLLDKVSYIRISLQEEDEAEATPIFTGCIINGEEEDSPGKKILTFRLQDYTWPLEAQKIDASPAYDGCYYKTVINDLMNMAGINQEGGVITNDSKRQPHLGAPPSMQELQWRFQEGSPIKDSMLKIAKLAWASLYFDAEGRLHYEDLPFGVFGQEYKDASSVPELYTGKWGDWTPENLVWNTHVTQHLIRDVCNAVEVLSSNRDMPGVLTMFRHVQPKSLNLSNTPGYIGFQKPYRIREGALEGTNAAAYSQFLAKLVFSVPRKISFETYGRPDLKINQVIRVDGWPWRLISVNMKFDASKNEYWMSCEGEWFGAAAQAGAGEDGAPQGGNGGGADDYVSPGNQ